MEVSLSGFQPFFGVLVRYCSAPLSPALSKFIQFNQLLNLPGGSPFVFLGLIFKKTNPVESIYLHSLTVP